MDQHTSRNIKDLKYFLENGYEVTDKTILSKAISKYQYVVTLSKENEIEMPLSFPIDEKDEVNKIIDEFKKK